MPGRVLPAVEVLWVDAASGGGWASPDQYVRDHGTLIEIRSVGLLLSRDRRRLVLVQSCDNQPGERRRGAGSPPIPPGGGPRGLGPRGPGGRPPHPALVRVRRAVSPPRLGRHRGSPGPDLGRARRRP